MLRSLIGDVNRKIILVFLLTNVLSMVAILIISARAYQQNIEFLLILNFSFILFLINRLFFSKNYNSKNLKC